MRYRSLGSTGLEVSVIGFGASPLGNEFGEADPEEGARAVQLAVDRGITYFDVSPYYGRTLAEERLGRALAGRRERVVLATKCGRYGFDSFDFSAARVRRSLDESLSRLRTDFVDILQVHDIEFGDADQVVEETLPALRELQRAGKCRFVGITGYSLRMLREVASRHPVDTVLSYCRFNLAMSDMDDELTGFCRERGIGLINAAPLHMRLFADAGPPAWHPAPPAVKEAARRAVEHCRAAGASIAEMAVSFCLGHPDAATTVVGMSTRGEVEANLRALDAHIDEGIRAEVQRLLAPVRNATWASGRPENQG